MLLLLLAFVSAWGQRSHVREEVRADWNKCSGLDCLYDCSLKASTPAPKGYEAFYVSHYGRHGSRYAYTSRTYTLIARMMEVARSQDGLTEFGEQIYQRMKDRKSTR